MIIDTSVIVAILSGEPERSAFNLAVLADRKSAMSVANYLEAHMVMSRFPKFEPRIDPLLSGLAIEVVPVSLEQGRLAIEAFRKFGKGRHPARLNYGDCFAYALAREQGEPLLFKGGDFDKTDVAVAAY